MSSFSRSLNIFTETSRFPAFFFGLGKRALLVLWERPRKGVLVYIDDIIVYGVTLEELYDNLYFALGKLR